MPQKLDITLLCLTVAVTPIPAVSDNRKMAVPLTWHSIATILHHGRDYPQSISFMTVVFNRAE